MLRSIEITSATKTRVRRIISDLKAQGTSDRCPLWNHTESDYAHKYCDPCKAMFPKLEEGRKCPCDVGYTPKYLIIRLNQILEDNIADSEYELGITDGSLLLE